MYTFENLEKFAPNGKAWQYIVAEESINGYTTTVNVGNLELGQVTGSSNSSLGVDGVVSDRMDYAPIETDDGKKTDVNEQFVTFANTYAPGTASFIGTKAWNDYGGLFAQGQTRPDITLTVTRVSEAGAKDEAWSISFGYPSGIVPTDGGPLVLWEGEGFDSSWTYTMAGHEKWAPDGTRWVYHVKEEMGENNSYRIVKGDAQSSNYSIILDDGNSYMMISNLRNALTGHLTVTKKWEDGDDLWGQRPDSVYVELQAKVGNGKWGKASDVVYNSLDESLKSHEGVLDFLAATSSQQRLYAGNNWSYTWESLPVSVNGNSIEYRAVETWMAKRGLNGAETIIPIKVNSTADEGNLYQVTAESPTSSYVPSQGTVEEPKGSGSHVTTITNKLQKTNLAVTKIWDDRNNAWNTRPLVSGESGNWEVTFYLQCSADDGGTWQWMNKGGEPSDERMDNTVSYTMQGSGNDPVKAVFEHLPKYNDSGKELKYRAVEKVPAGYEVAGAMKVESESSDANNEFVTVDSGVTVADDSMPTEDSGEPADAIQTFKNQLITINLSGTKK